MSGCGECLKVFGGKSKRCCSCCNQHAHVISLSLAARQVVMGKGQNRTNVVVRRITVSVRSSSGRRLLEFYWDRLYACFRSKARIHPARSSAADCGLVMNVHNCTKLCPFHTEIVARRPSSGSVEWSYVCLPLSHVSLPV